MGVDVHNDAVILEGNFGILSVDIAGRMRIATHVVAVLVAGEELLQQRALQRFGGDVKFNSTSGDGNEEKRESEKKTAHVDSLDREAAVHVNVLR